MWLYGVITFLSAFLVFQVQLLLGKYILPWYGGVPAVWTTCMLFFQTALLAGYAYAHWLAARPRLAMQRNLHVLLVAGSLALLAGLAAVWQWPLLPDAGWRPLGGESPIGHILLLLGATIGIPFLALSATAPLVQRWFSLTHPGQSPYRLYALSNVGSLVGLLGYPFLIEVLVPLRWQAVLWTAGYLLFAAGIVTAAVRVARRVAVVHDAPVRDGTAASGRPGTARLLTWFGLTACASALLLAVTNQMSQEIAVVPFLWVLPLALYLLTFVLCFAGKRWYPRTLYLTLFVPALILLTLALQRGIEGPLAPQILLYSASLFAICMVCHGELVRLKPAPRHLTAFYLTISAGGAAGGVFVAVVAPLLFLGYWELSIALIGCATLVGVLLWRDRGSPLHRHARPVTYGLLAAGVVLPLLVFGELLGEVLEPVMQWVQRPPVIALVAVIVLIMFVAVGRHGAATTVPGTAGRMTAARHRWLNVAAWQRGVLVTALLVFALVHAVLAWSPLGSALAVSRNFFGVLHVDARAMPDDEVALRLAHGRTIHGVQYTSRERRTEPTTYYTPPSGIGQALLQHPRRRNGQPLRIGVVGLGTGTLAAYGRAGDTFRFYEVDPGVVRLARGPEARFSYLRDSAAGTEVVLGDARRSLEREAPRDYDVLVLDAFSSGSIPLHLLTREAFAVYRSHLEPQAGVLAVHVSNRYLDLTPVVATLARALDLAIIRVDYSEPASDVGSTWLLLARRADALPAEGNTPAAPDRAPWSDDYSNLLHAIRWSRPDDTATPASMNLLGEDARLLDLAR